MPLRLSRAVTCNEYSGFKHVYQIISTCIYHEYGESCILAGQFGVQMLYESPGELHAVLRLLPVWMFLRPTSKHILSHIQFHWPTVQ